MKLMVFFHDLVLNNTYCKGWKLHLHWKKTEKSLRDGGKNHNTTIVGPEKYLIDVGIPNSIPTKVITLPETNIAPENEWLEDEFSYREGLFSREYDSFREYRRLCHLDTSIWISICLKFVCCQLALTGNSRLGLVPKFSQ